jgi:hypothetical protein
VLQLKKKYKREFLKVLRVFSTEWVGPDIFRIPFNQHFPQQMTGDKLVDNANLGQPRLLMEHIECLEDEKLIEVNWNVHEWEIPPIKITPRGVKWLEEYGWWKQRWKNLSGSVFETTVITIVSFLLGTALDKILELLQQPTP